MGAGRIQLGCIAASNYSPSLSLTVTGHRSSTSKIVGEKLGVYCRFSTEIAPADLHGLPKISASKVIGTTSASLRTKFVSPPPPF